MGEGTVPHVPDAAIAVALLLTTLSVGMLVYFFHHLTQQLRVESILEDLQRAALRVVEQNLDEGPPSDTPLPDVPDAALAVPCRLSGYLQMVEPRALLQLATEEGVVVRLRPRIGAACTEGTTLAWVWPVDPEQPIAADRSTVLADRVHASLHIGFERTMQQDVAFGIRQIVDIAVRALSPGINDPATAVAVIGALTPVLARLVDRRTGHDVLVDEAGRVRTAIDLPTFGELLALGCDQPRRYAASEPAVLVALLEMLADVAELATHDLAAVRTQIDDTAAAARDAGLTAREVERVEAMARRAVAVLEGRQRAAEVDLDDDVEEPAG